MRKLAPSAPLLCCLALAMAGCGGPSAHPAASGGGAAADVQISGRIAAAGTRGSVLVFAFTGTPDPATLADTEPASVSVVGPDGGFDLSVPPSDAVTLAFLADGSSDGVIDGGDPVVVLSDPRLSALQAGDIARVGNLELDFHAAQVRGATIDVLHAGASPQATRTATAVPAA